MNSDEQAAGLSGGNGTSSLGPITPVMVAHLRDTKPWARLVAIVGFVGSGFVALAALIIPIASVVSPEFGGPIAGVGLGLVYLLIAFLYFFPSLFLFRYASAIRKLLVNGDSESMELALFQQQRFWRLVGIATLIVVCLYALAFLGLIAFAVVQAMK